MTEPRKDDTTDGTDAGPAESAAPAATSPAAATPEPPAAATPEPPAAAPPAAATPPGTTSTATSSTAGATPAGRKGLLLGVGGAVALIAVLAIAAFVWPGFLAGPGKPDDTAAAAVASLGSKNAAELEKVSCHGPDGKSLGQLSPEALQVIQGAKVAGPTTLVLDTQAQQPIDLTLSAQGQTQNVPANLVFAVDDGKWCMSGLSMRQ